jgi:hypothetical protein
VTGPPFQPGEPVLVLVTWNDAYNGDHGWIDADELPEAIEGCRVRTAGWLVQESPAAIRVAMSMAELPSELQLCDLFTIPRGCIQRIDVLGDALNGPTCVRP